MLKRFDAQTPSYVIKRKEASSQRILSPERRSTPTKSETRDFIREKKRAILREIALWQKAEKSASPSEKAQPPTGDKRIDESPQQSSKENVNPKSPNDAQRQLPLQTDAQYEMAGKTTAARTHLPASHTEHRERALSVSQATHDRRKRPKIKSVEKKRKSSGKKKSHRENAEIGETTSDKTADTASRVTETTQSNQDNVETSAAACKETEPTVEATPAPPLSHQNFERRNRDTAQ